MFSSVTSKFREGLRPGPGGGEVVVGLGPGRWAWPLLFFSVLDVSAEVGLAFALGRGERSWAFWPRAAQLGLTPFFFSFLFISFLFKFKFEFLFKFKLDFEPDSQLGHTIYVFG